MSEYPESMPQPGELPFIHLELLYLPTREEYEESPALPFALSFNISREMVVSCLEEVLEMLKEGTL